MTHLLAGRTRPLLALVIAIAAIGLWTDRHTPADLLVAPTRPFQGYGNATVRIGTAAYPRHAIGTDDVQIAVERPPQRIISQDSHADEFLYSVVPAARIVGVSESAYEPRVSNVYDRVMQYRPMIGNDPERILLATPDLVFSPASARSDAPGLLRRAGIPVYRMYTMFETLTSIEDHVRLTGYLTGEDERADAEVQRFERVLQRAAARRPAGTAPLRVMGFGGAYSYGARTLFSDILRVLGAENVAATHGFVGYDRVTDEHIVRWDPDWIVAGADRGTVDEVRARLLERPAIAATSAARRGHLVVLDNQLFLPLSPFSAALVDALSQAFYGGAVP